MDDRPAPLDLREQAVTASGPAAGDAGDSIERFDSEVRNALAALVGATSLLQSRWAELPEDRRLLLVESAGRRAQELQAALLPVLGRLKAVGSRS